MNIGSLFDLITTNQRKMIQVLLAHPEGLLSSELAEMTAVSNKSATMTPDLRKLLEENGLELIIERVKGCSKWAIRPMVGYQEPQSALDNRFEEVLRALDEIARICQEVKCLLS